MSTYTIVGYYSDTQHRFCETVSARSVAAAQKKALKRWGGLVICGVFSGELFPVCSEFNQITYDKDWMP
jgi:hypothetical protein